MTRLQIGKWVGVLALGICLAVDAARAQPEGEAGPVAAGADVTLLDVDDVSILFARAADGAPVPNLGVGETVGPDAQIWSQDDFDRVIQFAENGNAAVPGSSPGIGLPQGTRDRGAWRVVGMRFDPCAPTTALKDAAGPVAGVPPQIPGCLVQVRLVGQPFVSQGGRLVDRDFTAHLVFTLPPDSASEATEDLRAIKRAASAAGSPTSGVPLGVHPALAREAQAGTAQADGSIAKAVAAFAKKWAGRALGRSISLMGLRSGGPEPWIFVAGRVQPGPGGGAPVWTATPIPIFLPAVVFHQRLSFIEAQNVIPPATRSPSTTPLFEDTSRKDPDLVFGVEHPRDHHFFDTDCISCHTSTALIVNRKIPSGPSRARVAKGVTGYAGRDVLQGNPDPRFGAFGSTWNVRNFGYFNGQPTVSLRTVAETAAVVELINLEVLPAAQNPARLAGPGRDCTARDDAVFDCLVHQGGGPSCLESCGPLLVPNGQGG